MIDSDLHPSRELTRCPSCLLDDVLQPGGQRIARCTACGFVLPTPDSPATAKQERLRVMPAVAPNGLLRGRYRLTARLGAGAHGVTYLAEHEYLRHPCVVKILPHHAGDSADRAVRRLREEARAGFRVHDARVVRVLDCDVVRGVWYFVMEYVDGVNLATLVQQRQRVNWRQAVHIASDVTRGLRAIHNAGILHRDVKPGNLMLGVDGRVRVADLGVARLNDHRNREGISAADAVGSLAYTAPEVFEPGRAVDARSDLYALGATMYHLMVGRLPHDARHVFQRLVDVQCRPVRWPAEMCADTPSWVIELILKLLAIEPDDRFASADELLSAMRIPEEEVGPVAGTPRVDAWQPRGIVVLPFENDGGLPDDDWIGHAIANYLTRALGELPDLYVADTDALLKLLKQTGIPEHDRDLGVVVGAAQKVGAGTVISGQFARSADCVSLDLTASRAGENGQTRAVARVHLDEDLASLARLERELLLRLARTLGYKRTPDDAPAEAALEVRERFTRGHQAFLSGAYEEAIARAEEALLLDPEFIEAVGFIGVCLARLGRYDQADQQHNKQAELARQLDDARRETEALANLGVMNYFRGRYEAAQAQFTEAATKAERLRLDTEAAQIYNNLGFVLYRLGRLEEAEEVFERAVDTHRRHGALTSLVAPYNGLGNVLAEQQRYDEARAYYRRALTLATELGDRPVVGTTHMHLGRCAARQGHFADAKHEFTMALNVLEEIRFWNGLARAYEYIADMNLQLGNLDEAVRCADRRIELSQQHANTRMEAKAWRQKAEALRRAGDEEAAAACEGRADRVEAALPATA